MKSKLLLILLATSLMPALGFGQVDTSNIGTLDYLEQKRGFKYIKLGSNIKIIAGKLELFKTDQNKSGAMKFYKVLDKNLMKVGKDITLHQVMVGVFKGKIARILVFMNSPNGDKLLNVFQEAYGNYRQPNEYLEDYHWWTDSVSLNLDFTASDWQKATFEDRPLMQEIEALKSEETKKAASGL